MHVPIIYHTEIQFLHLQMQAFVSLASSQGSQDTSHPNDVPSLCSLTRAPPNFTPSPNMPPNIPATPSSPLPNVYPWLDDRSRAATPSPARPMPDAGSLSRLPTPGCREDNPARPSQPALSRWRATSPAARMGGNTCGCSPSSLCNTPFRGRCYESPGRLCR